MKKVLLMLLSVICCLSLTACISTSYTPPENTGGNAPGTDTPNEENQDGAFTVKLSCEGEDYLPQTELSAQWYNGESLVTADFVDGVATAYGLDGDYIVTLSDIPKGYTYNPNINYASNRNKDIAIELLPLTGYTGTGAGWSDVIRMYRTGTYAVTFTEAAQTICCNFKPAENGTYILESIMDTTANEVNPRIEYYGQNTAWTPPMPIETCKDGGASSAYTRNFKYSGDIDGDCLNFAIRCDSRVDYPVTVYFTITYGSDYSRDPVYEMVVPKQIFDGDGNLIKSPEPTGGSYVKCGRESGNTNHILDASKFALGDDGYYHLKDGETLTSTIVYADLSTFVGGRTEESASGSYYVPTNLKVGIYDYTLFIKGWSGLLSIYGAESNVPEKYRDYKNMDGYYATTVKNGMCAVTEELRDFLQNYSVAKQLFFDGLGSAEQAGYNSSDADQWLYFCGYYI